MLDINDIYKLQGTWADFEKLIMVTGIHEWIITMGMDRAQPGSKQANRTFLSTIAKGKFTGIAEDKKFQWMHFVLRLVWVRSSEIKEIQHEINTVIEEFGLPDNITLERYLSSDIYSWCVDEGLTVEEIYPSYQNQYVAFTHMWQLMENGLFKCPIVPYCRIPGGSEVTGYIPDKTDLFREELANFDHNPDENLFGSPYKWKRKGGEVAQVAEKILDDSVYSVGWGIFSGRELFMGTPRIKRANMFGMHVKAGVNYY